MLKGEIINQHKICVMCNPWKRTFTFAPLALLIVFSPSNNKNALQKIGKSLDLFSFLLHYVFKFQLPFHLNFRELCAPFFTRF